jgi:hypothetical protein
VRAGFLVKVDTKAIKAAPGVDDRRITTSG